jgi:hypothetical protein
LPKPAPIVSVLVCGAPSLVSVLHPGPDSDSEMSSLRAKLHASGQPKSSKLLRFRTKTTMCLLHEKQASAMSNSSMNGLRIIAVPFRRGFL